MEGVFTIRHPLEKGLIVKHVTPTTIGLTLCIIGYLLGSIPFGLVISKLCGVVDPRTAGSKNIGFTNVLRLSGKKVGILTLLGDFGKGWLVSWLALSISGSGLWTLVAAFCVVFGHVFSVFLGFHGGKGVATGLGAILGLHPMVGGIMIFLWLFAVVIWRYSSGGALTAFAALPVLSVIMVNRNDFLMVSIGMSALIFYRHRENIKRLWNGTESRMGFSSS